MGFKNGIGQGGEYEDDDQSSKSQPEQLEVPNKSLTMLLLGIMENVSPLTSPIQYSSRQFDLFIFYNNSKHICSNANYAICLGKYTNIIHSRFCNNEHSLFVCSGLKGYSFQESWLGQTQIRDRARFSGCINQLQLKSV